MKKLLILAIVALASLTASAQQEVGTWSVTPKVGFNLATVTDTDDAGMKFGVVTGADLTYQVAEKFALTAGAFYSMQGAKDKDDGVTRTLKLDYINVPILANYYVIPGLALKVGLQPGFNLSHKLKAEYQGHSSEEDIPTFKSFDLSIPIGASYEFSDFIIDARYNFGLTKLVDQPGSSSKNSVIQVTVGYKIPLGN